MSGYSRAKFPHWDEDEQRCSTRERVLIEESRTPAQVDPYGCKVLSGDWLSLYDDVATDDPTAIEIDHFVPLAEAYRSGARDWDDARRRAFANDLQHPQALIAVTASSNRSKSDSDPAGWRPIRSYWCQYAIDWVVVKTAWDLSADAPEVDALLDMFATCTSVPAGPTAPPTAPAPTTRPATPTPPPTVPPSTTPPMPTTVVAPPSTAAGQCHPSYPTLCLPVDGPDVDCSDLQARNFRVLPPDPYRLDGNGDGIGCQS